MHFNKRAHFAALLFLSLFSASCGLRIGERLKPPSISETSFLGCMNNLKQQTLSYMEYSLEESQIEEMVRCIQSSLIIFKHHVWGEDRQNYTPEELRNFLHEFFLQNQEIDSELMDELMIFKTSIVGGGRGRLTSKEIDQIVKLLEEFKIFLFVIYHPLKQFSLKRGDVDTHLGAVRKALTHFFGLLFQNPYSLSSAQNLVKQITVFLNIPEKKGREKTLGLLKAMKPLIFHHTSGDLVQPGEWKVLLEASMDMALMTAHLRMKASDKTPAQEFIKTKTHHYSKAFHYFLLFFEKTLKDGPLSQRRLLDFASALKTIELAPLARGAFSIEKAVSILFGKILTGGGEPPFSVTKKEYLFLRSKYEKWQKRQALIDDIALHLKDSPADLNVFSLPEIQNSHAPEVLGFTQQSLWPFRPLYSEENPRDLNIYFKNKNLIKKDRFHYKNQTLFSFYSVIAEILFHGYAKESPEGGLTQGETRQLFSDVREIFSHEGQEKTQAPGDFGGAEFLVPNLFIYSTQGYFTDSFVEKENKRIELLSLKEAAEYLAFIPFIIHFKKQLTTEMTNLCSGPILISCFYENIVPAIQKLFLNMPHLLAELASMSEEDQNQYSDILFKIAAVTEKDKDSITHLYSSHLGRVVLTLLYQEVMFTRFDDNSNNILEEEEVLRAFPLYQGIIQSVAEAFCKDPAEMEEKGMDLQLYLYSVHSRQPNFKKLHENFSEKVSFGFRRSISWWNLEMTRPSLALLAYHLINQFLNRKKQISCPPKEAAQS